MIFLAKTLTVCTVLIAAPLAVLAGVYYLMFLVWAYVAVGILGAPALTYFQVVGVMVLINLLTCGFRLKCKL